jgi:hypothetical protein
VCEWRKRDIDGSFIEHLVVDPVFWVHDGFQWTQLTYPASVAPDSGKCPPGFRMVFRTSGSRCGTNPVCYAVAKSLAGDEQFSAMDFGTATADTYS